MKQRIASCPTCGAPVEFQQSTSLVSVCEFCQSVVARGDKNVADHGKVADLIQTDSPIKRGMTGRFNEKKFEVLGRVQYQHPAGGVWDEWYLAFPGNRWGWLAEAQGKYYLTTEKHLPQSTSLPVRDDLQVGQKLELSRGKQFTVTESGVARTGAAEGQIPWDFRPDIQHPFADLEGPDRAFATIDYSEDAPRVFIGKQIELSQLGLTGEGWESGMPPAPNVQSLQVSCPKCGGQLTLHAPDETLRVGCPNCRSLLSCESGNLEYLQTLTTKARKPLIPLGTVGRIDDVQYTVIGYMGRYVRYEGRTYPWTEYLLYHPEHGYRWLVENAKHWSFVCPLSAADVHETNRIARHNGKDYRIYDRSTAMVRYVFGEFYWKVSTGEQVRTADYIAPPWMLSFERSGTGESQELTVSQGKYMSVDEVEQAFQVKDLPRPLGVGVIQPKPQNGEVFGLWGLFLLLLFLTFAVLNATIDGGVDVAFFISMLVLMSVIPFGVMIYNYSFEVQRWRESDFSPYATDE